MAMRELIIAIPLGIAGFFVLYFGLRLLVYLLELFLDFLDS